MWDFQRSGSDPDVGFPEAGRQKPYHSTGARQRHIQETEEERLNWNKECYLNSWKKQEPSKKALIAYPSIMKSEVKI